MDHLDPNFDAWLDEQENEGKRVKLMNDYRARQANDLLLNINQTRILVSRARNGVEVDSAVLGGLVEKIKDLRGKISR